MLTEVSYGSLFIYYGSYLTKPVPVTACAWAWAAALRPVSFRPVNLNETKGTDYERQKFFNINAGYQPNSGIAITVVGERGRKELPPGTKADEHAPQQRQDQRPPRPASAAQPRQYGGPRQAVPRANGPTGDVSFEDKLKQFMQESDSRMADNKMYSDHRTSRRRR